MRRVFRSMIAAVVAITLMHLAGVAAAQTVKQIKLTEKNVEGFIAAHKDLSSVGEKMQGSASPKRDPQVEAELEEVAKKHGFSNYAEYDDVVANISMVLAGIDPLSKEFTEARVAIQNEIDAVNADTSIADGAKKQMLDELTEALKSAQPIEHPGNVELVRMYYDKIEVLMQ
jgi:hypothetical protein